MKITRLNSFVPLLRMLGLSLVVMSPTYAVNATWNGTTNASWSTTTNWSASPVPGTGDTATFNNAGGTVDTITTGNITISQILFDTANAAAYTLGGATAGTGQITLNDSGAITINSAVVNNQVINANIVLGNTTAASSYSFTNDSATSGQLLTIAGSVSSNQANATRAKTLTLGGSANGLVSGVISGNGSGNGSNETATVSILKNGLGTWTLSNANTYSGTTTIRAGTLSVGAAAPSGSAGALGNTTSAVVLGDGTTALGDGPSLLINGAFTVARAITVGSVANTAAYRATIGGSNTTGTSTFTGNITLNNTAANYTTTLQAATGGTVDFITGTWTTNDRAIAIGSSGNTGTVKLSNILSTTGGVSVNFGAFLLGASNRIGDTTPVTVAGGIFDTGTALTDTVSVFNMSSGSLNGTGTITAATYGLSGGTVTGNLGTGTLNSSGTVALNGTAGATAVNVTAGTLTLGSANRLNDSATVTVSGGILAMGANNDTVSIFNMSSGSLTGSSTLTAGTYGLSGGTVTGNLGTGTMNVTVGTVTLNGTAGATGVNVNSGTLAIGASNRLADSAAISLAGGSLDIGSFNDSVGAVTLSSGSITGTGGTLTGNSYAVESGSVSAILGGSGSLTKSTAGTVTLSGANTYTGTTTINGGILSLASTGSINNSSGVVLNSGTFNVSAITGGYAVASLAGNGSVTGDLSVTGTLGIGASPGAITFNDDLTLGGSSVSNFEISLGFASYDLATSGLGSQIVNFGGTLNLLFDSGFNTGGTVKIFDFENYAGNFTSVVSTGLASGFTATFDQTTGFVTVVPEPKAALLGCLGALALLRRRRVG